MEDQRRRSLGVVGLGRLGLSIALCFERQGFRVFGYDLSPTRTSAVRARELQSREPGVSELLRKSTQFTAEQSLRDVLSKTSVVYVCVPTQSTMQGGFECSTVSDVLWEINQVLSEKKTGGECKHIVLCSTVYPRYIADVGCDLLRDCDATLSYVPDAAVPLSYGNLLSNISRPEIVLIGQATEQAGDVLEWMHREMIEGGGEATTTFCRVSPTSAEIAKLASSAFSAVRCSFANCVTQLAERTPDASAADVLNVLKCDGRFGRAFLKPGMGYGGPCIPRDNLALVLFAGEVGVNCDLLASAQRMNQVHAEFMADMLVAAAEAAKDNGSASASSSPRRLTIVLEQVAFKEGCMSDLIDESPKLEVARILAKRGHLVRIRDRVGIINLVRRRFGSQFEYEIM